MGQNISIKVLVLSAIILWQGVFAGCSSGQESLLWPEVMKNIRNKFPDVRPLSTDELYSWQKDPKHESIILIDAREDEEFQVSHIPGALHIPHNKKQLVYLKDMKRDSPIVVYCSIGYRSSILAERLQGLGFGNVYNLEGSIFKWANEERPLVNKDQTTAQKVHPYNSHWGKLLESKYHAKVD